ncbi:glycosyltransferase family 4 protein [Ruicaihuangia caeni]|uniref:Glycosyltransferase family 4 protein n=1 Tax=Ruicaihuangia caeni TaxID=3042517 RepID=A0AAW6TDC7_9MICO|nr:glycosyltransferase family 4 protein [Klugiella sp. YN-L-19]MDI2099405.1 glycosyltransferase family 4 protein [Klugiella sp. YN-L-19]
MPEPAAASYRLAALAVALSDSGARVRVVTTRAPRGFADDRFALQGVQIDRAPVLRDRTGYVRGYLQYMSFDLPALLRILLATRPDFIVVEPPPTTGCIVRVAARIKRTRYAYFAADIWSDAVLATTAPRAVARMVRALERWAVEGADIVLSTSDESTERLKELFPSVRVVTVGNGIDTGVFVPEGEVRSDGDGPYFLYAGTASEVHGAAVFIKAFQQVLAHRPEARLVFIGHGADYDELRAAAEKLPDGAVRFYERLSPEELGPWIRGAVATLASVHPDHYHRAFPTKMYASVACGTPVIYSGIGPGRQFATQNRLGWGVDYDSSRVAEAMRAALERTVDAQERTRIAEWARRHVSLDAVGRRAVDAVAARIADGTARSARALRKQAAGEEPGSRAAQR